MAHVAVVGGHGCKGGANGWVKQGFRERKGQDVWTGGEQKRRVGAGTSAAENGRKRVLLCGVFVEQKKQAFHAMHPGPKSIYWRPCRAIKESIPYNTRSARIPIHQSWCCPQ
jgi:hypothetical protein